MSVKAQLDRDTVMAGESVNLSVSIEGGNPESMENFPPIAGLTIQYRGPSQNVISINGRTTVKHILSFSIQPSQPGEYSIPGVNVRVDGAAYPTEPLKLIVTKAEAVNANNRYAFLKLNVPRQEIYIGEIIPIEVQLYLTDGENLQAPQLKSDGFIVHKQLENTRSQSQIGNILYNVLSFKMSVSAAKAGQLTLGPAEMNLTLRLRAQPDPNDVFGFMGRFQRRPISLASPAVSMTVLPLPPNAPPDFSGAIGKFNWTVTAGPNAVNAGDPITMKAVISGRGNLDNLKLPDVNWPGFKVYPPNVSVAPQDQLGLSGTKTFEQVIVPQSATVREIPAFSLTYFDPEQKQYATLKQAATPITVRPSAGGQAQPTVLAARNGESEQPEDRTDIVHIKADPGPMFASAPPFIQQPWFLVMQALPLIGLVGVSVWRKRQDQLANNPKLRRKIEVQRTIATGLVQLRELANSNQVDEFYALTFRLLQEQLGERLDLPASAITEAVLSDRLPRRGASTELIRQLQDLFQQCNQARYAPVRTNEQLLAVASNLEKALGELQQLPD